MIKGFTCGTFDLCHAGHMLMFKECKTMCDYLIVGLQTDPSIDRPEKHKPVQSLEERMIQLESVKYIDEIVIYTTETELYNLLKENKLGIDFRILGEDHRSKKFTGYDLPIKTLFNTRGYTFSSSDLRRRITGAEKKTLSNF